MRKLGLLAVGLALLGSATVSPEVAVAASGGCGAHPGDMNSYVRTNAPGFVRTAGEGVLVFITASGLAPGTHVVGYYGRDMSQDVGVARVGADGFLRQAVQIGGVGTGSNGRGTGTGASQSPEAGRPGLYSFVAMGPGDVPTFLFSCAIEDD